MLALDLYKYSALIPAFHNLLVISILSFKNPFQPSPPPNAITNTSVVGGDVVEIGTVLDDGE